MRRGTESLPKYAVRSVSLEYRPSFSRSEHRGVVAKRVAG